MERSGMATERLSMRKLREILRQKWPLARSHRQVAASLNVSVGTVTAVLRRATHAGLDWAQVQTGQSGSRAKQRCPNDGPVTGSERIDRGPP